jgi:hypothetical protein
MSALRGGNMNKFIRHIPNFVDVDDRSVFDPVEFEATEDLLNIPVVKGWLEQVDFSHFAMSDEHLMAILDDGFHWWVVGRVEKPERIDLPRWDEGRYRAIDHTGQVIIVEGTDVCSSCGGVLTLHDGRKLKKYKED